MMMHQCHIPKIFVQNGDAGEDRLGFYTGDIGKNLVADLRELGGIITEEDMRCIYSPSQENRTEDTYGLDN